MKKLHMQDKIIVKCHHQFLKKEFSMSMTQLVFFLSLLISYNIDAASEGFWDSLYKFFFDAEKKPTINYRVLEEAVGMIIDTVLGIDEQSKEIRADIVKFKEIKMPVIMKRLKSMRLNDYYEAVTQARELTYDALTHHIGQKAVKYADQLLDQSHEIIENRAIIKKEIEQEFATKAKDEKKETYCGLCHLYGDKLKQEVEKKIQNISQRN